MTVEELKEFERIMGPPNPYIGIASEFNITGQWELVFSGFNIGFPITATLRQEGTKGTNVTGSFTTPSGQKEISGGKLNNNVFTMHFTSFAGSNSFTGVMKATLQCPSVANYLMSGRKVAYCDRMDGQIETPQGAIEVTWIRKKL